MRRSTLPRVFSAEIAAFFDGFSCRVHKALLAYCVGLVMLARFRSVKRIAEEYLEGKVDSLHHFLKNSPCRGQKLRAALNGELCQGLCRSDKVPLLIIDDTPIEREGPAIEGVGVHYGGKGLVKGQCVVTAILRQGNLKLGLAVKGYRPKCSCPPEEFQSKVDLAVEVLEEAASMGAKFTVLLDAWYACQRVLNSVAERGWRYLAAIKSNRRIVLEGNKSYVRHLAKGPRSYQRVRLSRKRWVKVAKRIVLLPKVGLVALFIIKTRGETKYLISNDLELTPAQAVKLYGGRWSIETWHRDLKQHLGFAELWVRSWQACQRHWTLCLVTHNTLVLWNASLPAKSRKRTFGSIVRSFRTTVQAPAPIAFRHLYLKAA